MENSPSEEFPTLFHYTTVEGFRGIWRSGVLWASHYSGLNDSLELQQFHRIALRRLKPMISDMLHAGRVIQSSASSGLSKDEILEHEARVQLDTIHESTFGSKGLSGIFIASFCHHAVASYEATHGLLSQWRGYGSGGGVALVLDTSAVERALEREHAAYQHIFLSLSDTKYLDERVKDCGELEDFFRLMPDVLRKFYNRQDPNYGAILNPYVKGSTRTKHPAFREENEVRIIVGPSQDDPNSIFRRKGDSGVISKKIKYRPNIRSEVAYIELFDTEDIWKSAIQRVIIGPSRTPNLNYQTVADELKGSDVEISRSETPLVS